MKAAPAAFAETFAAGCYGKIPATGDFVVRRLPAAFSERWDRWLQEVMAGSRERLGARWNEAYLSMPAWRFLFSPGLVTPDAWSGLMVPSADAVGRYFPFTIACALPGAGLDLAATMAAGAEWFDAMEAVALEALTARSGAASVDAAIAARPFREAWLQRRDEAPDATVPFRSPRARIIAVPPALAAATAAQLAEPNALWLPGETETVERRALLCEGLPGAAPFCGMMEGRWREHGWSERVHGGAEAA